MNGKNEIKEALKLKSLPKALKTSPPDRLASQTNEAPRPKKIAETTSKELLKSIKLRTLSNQLASSPRDIFKITGGKPVTAHPREITKSEKGS